ncbi:MAG: hypothetical protein JO283_13255, partial [Bradyrhizobium sp.]|nr:hypothetical protein [Bradyrhizobium sp.]
SLLTDIGFDGWAVLERKCCVKSPGTPREFVRRHLIESTTVAFDDFAKSRPAMPRQPRSTSPPSTAALHYCPKSADSTRLTLPFRCLS